MKRLLSYDELIEISQNEPEYFFQIFKNYIHAIINKKILLINKNNRYIYIYNDKNINKLSKMLSIIIDGSITVNSFIDRLIKYVKCSISCYVFTMYHILHIYKNKIININENNIYKVIIITLLFSIKFLEDKPIKLKYYSRYVGVDIYEIKYFERLMFREFDYNINIDKEFKFIF